MMKKIKMKDMITIFLSLSFASMVSAALELTVASSGGNTSSPLKYGMLYEVSKITHILLKLIFY
jgi:hypothetical protein